MRTISTLVSMSVLCLSLGAFAEGETQPAAEPAAAAAPAAPHKMKKADAKKACKAEGKKKGKEMNECVAEKMK